MANIVEYVYQLQDRVSKSLGGIINTSIRLENQAKKTQSAFDNLGKTVLKFAAGYIGIQQAIRHTQAFIGSGEKSYLSLMESQAKLTQIMGNTMNARKEDVESIMKLASAQEKVGVINRKVQIAGAQELSTYLTKKSTLEKLLPVMNNMLAQQYGVNASQEQAQNIAQMMGKVMDGQVGALSRYGYKFSDVQENILKYGNEAQRAAVLTDVITSSIGGVNEALRNTPQGRLKAFGMEYSSLQERMGGVVTSIKEKLTPIGERFIEKLSSVIDYLEKRIDKITSVIQRAISITWSALAPVRALITGLFNVMKFLDKNREILAASIVVLGTYKILLWNATLATKGWTMATMLQYKWLLLAENAQKLLNITLLKSPFTTALVGVSLLVGAIIMLRKRTKEATDEYGALKKKAGDYAGTEISRLDVLFEALKKTNPKSKERLEIVKQLKELYPDLLSGMNLENAGVNDLAKAYSTLSATIMRRAMTSVYDEEIADIAKQKRELMRDTPNADKMIQLVNKLREEGREGWYKPGGMFNKSAEFTFSDGVKIRAKDAYNFYNKIGKLNKQQKDVLNLATNNELGNFSTNNTGGIAPANLSPTTISDLTSGGSKATNITINLRNLIEHFNLKTETFKEGVDKGTDELIEGLLRVVNSANRIAAQ